MKIKFGDNSLNLKVDGSLANIDRGPRGYSAYEIAVQEGFVGTEEEWLASLVGPEGKQGKDGERGIQGPRGQQGDKGEKGDTGPQGDKGEKGDAGPQGDKGDRGDTGPQGDKGEKGDTGPSNVLSIGSVTKGDEANATITGESPNQILNLVLPKGDKGEKGDTGPQGETGATGNGILSIQKTATAGLVDTYTTTFTDGTTTTFDVTNGEDGEVTQKQLDETNENVSWLQTLTDQMPHVAGQGTDLSLQSVLNYRLMKFLPQGVSSQESTTGSNIIGLDNEQYHVNLRAGDKIVVTNETDSTVTIDLFTNYGDTTRNDYWTITTAQSPRVITIANDSLAIKWHSVPNGKAWANLGETALPYEPYTDGPAPNPSYPYPVKSVTGENSLVINSANLFDKDSGFRLGYINASGTFVSATATACFNQYIPCQPNTNYTISFNKNISSLGAPIYYTINKTFLSRENAVSSVSKRTFTTPENCYYMVIQFNADGSTMTQEKIDGLECQLVKGSTAPTTYVEHEEQNYQLSLGNIELNSSPDGTIGDGIKGSSAVSYNLFDKNNVIKGNYQINSSQTLISSNSNRTLFIPCKPNTTYTVQKIISNYFVIGFINEEPSANISVTGYKRNASLEYLTSTSDSDSKYLACWYYNTGETLTEQEILDSIQIIEGSEAKPYFPYGQVGMWFKREYIGKVVLDGVNNVFTAKSNTTSNQLYISDEISNMVIPSSNNVLGKGLSSHFKIKTAQNIYSNDLIGFGIRTDNKISFAFGISSNLTSLALANQWLQTQYNNGTPVTTYYLHVNYVDIPITNTTLINQLNNIYNNAHSYNGVTNITTTYESGNEQMYLDIEALAKGGSTTTETDPIFSASASSGITSSDITNWNNKADVEDIPDLTDYVKNTNFASNDNGGVFKTSSVYKTVVYPLGTLRTLTVPYTDYGNLNSSAFIGKGTLENVITGKNLADKNYVDTAIATAITNTLGGSY